MPCSTSTVPMLGCCGGNSCGVGVSLSAHLFVLQPNVATDPGYYRSLVTYRERDRLCGSPAAPTGPDCEYSSAVFYKNTKVSVGFVETTDPYSSSIYAETEMGDRNLPHCSCFYCVVNSGLGDVIKTRTTNIKRDEMWCGPSPFDGLPFDPRYRHFGIEEEIKSDHRDLLEVARFLLPLLDGLPYPAHQPIPQRPDQGSFTLARYGILSEGASPTLLNIGPNSVHSGAFVAVGGCRLPFATDVWKCHSVTVQKSLVNISGSYCKKELWIDQVSPVENIRCTSGVSDGQVELRWTGPLPSGLRGFSANVTISPGFDCASKTITPGVTCCE